MRFEELKNLATEDSHGVLGGCRKYRAEAYREKCPEYPIDRGWEMGGPYWDRTSDLCRVKAALSR